MAVHAELDVGRGRGRAARGGASVFGLSPVSFPRAARANLSLALGGDCVHTFACSKFLLSHVYGDVPARD
ncbi:MAG: hypothetical protein LC803_15475 [Acidobacteria bacterium]|nr:hypothetical protein [Acidobacteriota bacterium]